MDPSVAAIIEGPPFLLMLGRMCYYKGLEVVLAALQRNQSAGRSAALRIVIAGKDSDDCARSMSAKLTRFVEVVRINRLLTEDEKVFLLQSCVALLFPSNKPSEAFGIVQLEALATGRPIVNFNLPTGVPEVSVNGKTGLTFEVDDHVAISDLMAGQNRYLDALQSITIENIEKHLAKFSAKIIIPSLIDCYRSMK